MSIAFQLLFVCNLASKSKQSWQLYVCHSYLPRDFQFPAQIKQQIEPLFHSVTECKLCDCALHNSQFTLLGQSFNPTRQDRTVAWVFSGICILVKMKTASFYFCAWSLHERGVNVFAARNHFSLAVLSPLHSLIAKIPPKFTVT